MKEEITVNDGKGFLDSAGLCDSLILDLNNLTKATMTGNYILYCTIINSMSQKVVKLKDGIKADMDSMKKKVEELKRVNDSLVEQITGLPVEKDGADNGDN